MTQIRVTLYREGVPAIHAEATLSPEAALNSPELRHNAVTIAVLGDLSHGGITLPVDLLSALMAKVMQKAGSQPPPPKLVLPN